MTIQSIQAQGVAPAQTRPYCAQLSAQIAKICTAVKNFFYAIYQAFERGAFICGFRLTAGCADNNFDSVQKERETLVRQGVAQLAQGFFYEIRDPQNQTQGYLLGNIHVMDKEMFGWQPRILEALRNSTDLALENDLRDYGIMQQRDAVLEEASQEILDDPALDWNAVRLSVQNIKPVMLNLGWIAQGDITNLEAKAARKSGGVKAQVLDEFKSLNQIADKRQKGSSDELNSDDRLLVKAHRLGKGILGLEGDISTQYTKAHKKVEIRSSLVAVDAGELQQQIQDGPRHWQELKGAWMQGSMPALREFLLAEEERQRPQMERDPVLQQLHREEFRIVDERNREQAEKIDQFIRQGKRLFVDVGAAHLVDFANMTGVITRLQRMGWQVVQA